MRYDIRTGGQHKKANMKKVIVAGVVSLAATGAMAAPAFASAPISPGCFGQDRSTNITTGNIPPGPGASGWGHMAADRAGDNGTMNQAYKTSCGGDPATP